MFMFFLSISLWYVRFYVGEAFLYKMEQFPHRLVQWSTIVYYCLSFFVSGKFWEIRKSWRNRPRLFLLTTHRQKKSWEFPAADREKITPDSLRAVDLCIGLRFCWRMWKTFFFREREYKKENNNYFSEKTRIANYFSENGNDNQENLFT